MTNSLTKTLLTAAAIGLAATVPFTIMELVNRQGLGLSVVAVAAADGWTTWVSDQWPCFMGVRNCD